MRNLLSATALTAALVLSGPVLAQSVGSPSSGTSQGSGAAGAQMQGQVPAGPLPMTQPAPGTPSTSQRPSTAAGALGATKGQPGSAGQSLGTQSSTMGQSGSQASGSQAGGTPSTGSQSAAMAENDVRGLLRTEGYSDVQSVSRDGNNFRVRAMRNGRPADVTVDAYTGTIRNQAARR